METKMAYPEQLRCFQKDPQVIGIYIYIIVWQQVLATNILKPTKLSSILGSFDDFISWKVTCTTIS